CAAGNRWSYRPLRRRGPDLEGRANAGAGQQHDVELRRPPRGCQSHLRQQRQRRGVPLGGQGPDVEQAAARVRRDPGARMDALAAVGALARQEKRLAAKPRAFGFHHMLTTAETAPPAAAAMGRRNSPADSPWTVPGQARRTAAAAATTANS